MDVADMVSSVSHCELANTYISALYRIPQRGCVHEKLDHYFAVLLLTPRVKFLDRIDYDVNASARFPCIRRN